MSQTSYNRKQAVVVIVQDVLLLAELALAIYLGHTDLEQLTPVFLRTFIPLALVTTVVGRWMIRRLADAPVPPATAGA